MAHLDEINRSVKAEVLPDMRLRITRRYDITQPQAVTKTEAQLEAGVVIAWGTADVEYPDCRLTHQDVEGQQNNPNKSPNDPPPYLIRIYEQIPENARVQVGRTEIDFDQYGRKTVVETYIQFSDGSDTYSEIVGTTAAPSPNEACILKTVESTNDGTLITTKLTFTDSGELADNIEIRFNGTLLERELVYLNEVPPVPSGYTYIGTSIEYIQGLPLYRAKFVAAATGGVPGAGGVISDETQYAQSPDQGTTGVTIRTIQQISTPAVSSNPISSPGAGYQLVDFKYDDGDGYRRWTAIFAKGQGVIETNIRLENFGFLVIYEITTINAVPTPPSPTIGGTVVQIDSNIQNGQRTHDGTVIHHATYAEGNGVISNDTVGESDGAIVQTIVELDAAPATPSSPGMGWYLISLSQQAASGHYVNRAVYKQPPATVTFKKDHGWQKPGLAYFTTSPDALVKQPPVPMTLLADYEISYDTSQITDTPFTVSGYAFASGYYTPVGGSIQPVNEGLGGYLAGASSVSGTAASYNGILCDTYSVVLISSIPSAIPAGATVLAVDNDPYLTAIDGTVVFRRTKVSYTF